MIANSESEPTLYETESLPFNPELVTWVTNSSGESIPILTKNAMVNFVKNNDYGSSGFIWTAYTQIVIADTARDLWDVREYVYFDDNNTALGLLAERFSELVERLKLGTSKVYRSGEMTIGLLEKISEAIYLPEEQ